MCILGLIYIYIYIHTHTHTHTHTNTHSLMVHGDRKFWGKLTPVTVMLRVTNIEENTKQKHPQTHEESHYSLPTETHPVPGTQTYIINHNIASPWDNSN